MAIYARSKEFAADNVRETLDILIQNFDADSAGSRKQVKDLFDNDPELAYAAALSVLNSPGESSGSQYLVSFLAANGMLQRALCSPACSRDEAIALARAARRSDPEIDVVIARSLADSALGGGHVHVENPARLLDILSEVADAGRIVPSLMRLMRHPDLHLRSKAVKMIGRGSHSAKWVMGRLSESDPRVRANAVESLWGVDIPEARTLLNFAASDANHRVVCNSLLGLYYLGDSAILTEIIKLAGRESADFRAAAAWVMGETGDPRFSDALRRMIADREPAVRKSAFASLAQLKLANSTLPVGDLWHVAGRALPVENSKGLKRLMVAVAANDLREQLKITPLHFLLSEGSQHVLNYSVTEKTLPEAMSVVFVIPRSRVAAGGAFFQGVLDCLRWKRPGDPWSILPYIETGAGEAPPPRDPEPPSFTTNGDALAASLRETPKKLDCTDLWTGIWRAIKPEGGQSRGKRHVIVLSSAQESRVAGPGLISEIAGGRMSVQVIRSGPNQQLEEFCQRTSVPQRSGGDEDIVKLIHQAYLKLLARYELAWQTVGTGDSPVRLRVQTPVGWGETLIT